MHRKVTAGTLTISLFVLRGSVERTVTLERRKGVLEGEVEPILAAFAQENPGLPAGQITAKFVREEYFPLFYAK